MNATASRSDAAEGGSQLRHRGHAVDVVVAEDDDPFPAARRRDEKIRGLADAEHARGIVEGPSRGARKRSRLRGLRRCRAGEAAGASTVDTPASRESRSAAPASPGEVRQ